MHPLNWCTGSGGVGLGWSLADGFKLVFRLVRVPLVEVGHHRLQAATCHQIRAYAVVD